MKSKRELVNLACMVSEDIVSVSCIFTEGDSNSYQYKAERALNLKADDVVIVTSTKSKTGFVVLIVSRVDDACLLDNVEGCDYQWVVAKLDVNRLVQLKAWEHETADALNRAQVNRAREQVLRTLGITDRHPVPLSLPPVFVQHAGRVRKATMSDLALEVPGAPDTADLCGLSDDALEDVVRRVADASPPASQVPQAPSHFPPNVAPPAPVMPPAPVSGVRGVMGAEDLIRQLKDASDFTEWPRWDSKNATHYVVPYGWFWHQSAGQLCVLTTGAPFNETICKRDVFPDVPTGQSAPAKPALVIGELDLIEHLKADPDFTEWPVSDDSATSHYAAPDGWNWRTDGKGALTLQVEDPHCGTIVEGDIFTKPLPFPLPPVYKGREK